MSAHGADLAWRRAGNVRELLDARTVLGSLALAGLYYGSARLCFTLKIAGPIGATVWLPVGIGIAALYLAGVRLWPGILLGDLLANNYAAIPLGPAVGQTFGNVLEVVVAVLLLRRADRCWARGSEVARVVCMLGAISVGTAISATIGLASLVLGHVVSLHAVGTLWRTWWLGDTIGAVVVVSIALAWRNPPFRLRPEREAGEIALVLVSIVALGRLASQSGRPLSYVVFPALIWSALRLGRRGASLAVLAAAFVASRWPGEFRYRSIGETLLSTQLYIAVTAVTTLMLAAVAAERQALTNELRRSRARLLEAGDAERRRIERDLHDGLQQRLTVLAFKIHRWAEESAAVPGNVDSAFKAAEEDVVLAIDELRDLTHGIRPPVLADLGLAAAIRSISVRSVIPVRLLELPSGRFDGTAETTAYYVVAEAVTNAHKHARASHISVQVVHRNDALHVAVRDDGVGGAREATGFGLQGLRDRVEATGGSFGVTSMQGGGTVVSAVVPTVATL